LEESLGEEGLPRGLDGYHFLYSARADLLRRLGRVDQARADHEIALRLATNPVERAFLSRRLAHLSP
jgi:RNA polymerase sigma-70 factor (ECF subfamily)